MSVNQAGLYAADDNMHADEMKPFLSLHARRHELRISMILHDIHACVLGEQRVAAALRRLPRLQF